MVTRLALSDFPRMQQLPQYIFKQVIGWMEKARAAGEDIVDFGMGNPDGATPPHILAKVREEIELPRTQRYSVSRGNAELRQAICAWSGRR